MESNRRDPKEVEAGEIRVKIDLLVRDAELVEICTEGASGAFWTQVVRPEIEKIKAAFAEAALDMDLTDEKAKGRALMLQGRAQFARELLDLVDRKLEPGYREGCLREAQRLQGILERHGK